MMLKKKKKKTKKKENKEKNKYISLIYLSEFHKIK